MLLISYMYSIKRLYIRQNYSYIWEHFHDKLCKAHASKTLTVVRLGAISIGADVCI